MPSACIDANLIVLVSIVQYYLRLTWSRLMAVMVEVLANWVWGKWLLCPPDDYWLGERWRDPSQGCVRGNHSIRWLWKEMFVCQTPRRHDVYWGKTTFCQDFSLPENVGKTRSVWDIPRTSTHTDTNEHTHTHTSVLNTNRKSNEEKSWRRTVGLVARLWKSKLSAGRGILSVSEYHTCSYFCPLSLSLFLISIYFSFAFKRITKRS